MTSSSTRTTLITAAADDILIFNYYYYFILLYFFQRKYGLTFHVNLLPTFHMRCNLISSENNKKYVYNILYEIGSVIFLRFVLICFV